MNNKQKFENFLESLKGKGHDTLIESVKKGLQTCLEAGWNLDPNEFMHTKFPKKEIKYEDLSEKLKQAVDIFDVQFSPDAKMKLVFFKTGGGGYESVSASLFVNIKELRLGIHKLEKLVKEFPDLFHSIEISDNNKINIMFSLTKKDLDEMGVFEQLEEEKPEMSNISVES